MKISPTAVRPRLPHDPMLRLVNAEGLSAASVLRVNHASPRGTGYDNHSAAQRRERLVAAENQSASGLAALDPRWIFAVQVAKSLEGGRAALLVLERRQKLLTVAAGLGLRPFDANLVIAVVQDGVRTGEGGLGHDAESRLRLVRPVGRRSMFSESTIYLMVSGATAVVALGIFLVALAWLRG